jgi:hypothetical protein
MGVYIRGMEMPTSCYKCPLKRRDGMDIVCPVAHERFSVADVNILEYRLSNCPIASVPPHGDLIERKAAYDSLLDGMVMTGYQSRALDCISDFYVPTVIEAEEGE